jgi:hypothetical protein
MQYKFNLLGKDLHRDNGSRTDQSDQLSLNRGPCTKMLDLGTIWRTATVDQTKHFSKKRPHVAPQSTALLEREHQSSIAYSPVQIDTPRNYTLHMKKKKPDGSDCYRSD